MRTIAAGPMMLAFLPAATLLAYWSFGEAGLIAAALAVPALSLAIGLVGGGRSRGDGLTGLALRADAVATLDVAVPRAVGTGRAAAAMAAGIDNLADALRDLDGDGEAVVLTAVADRMRDVLRDTDVIARLDRGRFVIALADMRRADQDTLLRLACRLQAAAAEPISVGGQRAFVTLSVGFCLPGRLPRASGEALVAAAEAALSLAQSNGGCAVRAYAPGMASSAVPADVDGDGLRRALDNGEIVPWFQPQVDARTGAVVGMEALARWSHPQRGIVPPAEFLADIAAAGLSRRLSEVMLYATLQALRGWDRAGLGVGLVAVNFGQAELTDPALADRVRWELDRFDLEPGRLTIEVSETALVAEAATVERTLRTLARLGCAIDLDDFGTGNTSIASLKRFSVARLKIDRSFVTQVDRDRDQADIVAAILTMARGLGLGTVAEGVESVAEQSALAALGCDSVQGFAIARPMPADEVAAWITGWRRKLGPGAQSPGVIVPPQPMISGKTA